MLLTIPLLWLLTLHIQKIMSMDCEYSSREYQVVLRPDLLMNSFENGVTRVIDELAKIEDAKTMKFKVSRSSLKYKNVTIVRYIPEESRDSDDFYIPIIFKSRRKKLNEPADIVFKISNPDPLLTCIPLMVAEDYVNSTKIKFELDIHGENGQLRSKSAHSYTIDLPLEFDQTIPINMSSILVDSATKITHSGQSIIVVPDSAGKVTMQTAEFNVNLAGQKSDAAIMYFRREDDIKAEFSFRVKGATVSREVLIVAQALTTQLSEIPTIALYALIQPK